MFHSHLEAILYVNRFFKLHKVIEFGPGSRSTEFFLREIKELKKLISLENQTHFGNIVRNRFGEDSRWKLIIKNENKLLEVAKSHAKCDLLLIDGETIAGRNKVIQIAGELSDLAIVHDTENGNYDKELSKYKHRKIFSKDKYPKACLFSNVIDVNNLENEN